MRQTGRRFPWGVAMKALVMALAVLGQAVSMRQHSFMSGNHFLYYTNQSNLLVLFLMAALMPFARRAARDGAPCRLPRFLSAARFVITSAVFLTFVGFSVLLLPMLSRDYLLSPANLLVHNAVPLLACADYVLFADNEARPRVAWGLLGPALYGVFALFLALGGHRFYGSVAPYFFLDYEKQGWIAIGNGRLGVIYWLALMGLLQAGLSWLIIKMQKAAQSRARKDSAA